jgi:hypothetical protein
MVSGAGSGGVDRIGGTGVRRIIAGARESGSWDDPLVRQRLMSLWCEERVREWTNARVRDNARAGRPPGPESSIGKVRQGELNKLVQEAAVDLLGAGALAWVGEVGTTTDPAAYAESLPYALHGTRAGPAPSRRHQRGQQNISASGCSGSPQPALAVSVARHGPEAFGEGRTVTTRFRFTEGRCPMSTAAGTLVVERHGHVDG